MQLTVSMTAAVAGGCNRGPVRVPAEREPGLGATLGADLGRTAALVRTRPPALYSGLRARSGAELLGALSRENGCMSSCRFATVGGRRNPSEGTGGRVYVCLSCPAVDGPLLGRGGLLKETVSSDIAEGSTAVRVLISGLSEVGSFARLMVPKIPETSSKCSVKRR